jgi:Bax protein
MNQGGDESVVNSRPFQLAVGGTILVAMFMLAMSLGRARPQFPSLPDFSSFARVDDMKEAFFDYLTPIVRYYNTTILADRNHLKRIAASVADGDKLSWVDAMWLQRLAEQYAVDWNEDKPDEVVRMLIRRVDIIPVPLVLAQAAKESSWGQSRFAVQAHNLFGQWCFHQGCGVEPDQRPEGAKHEVRRFKTASESVRSYLHNLNTHASYAALRRIRQQLREDHRAITADALADGLASYSERRDAYVEEVKSMIAQYQRFQGARAE